MNELCKSIIEKVAQCGLKLLEMRLYSTHVEFEIGKGVYKTTAYVNWEINDNALEFIISVHNDVLCALDDFDSHWNYGG